MKRGKLALIGVLIIFLVANVAAIDQTMLDWIGTNISQQEMGSTSESRLPTQQEPDDRAFSISDDQLEGTLDPMQIEQSGYASSGNISARTDTMSNLAYDLPLDEAHNWIASEAEVSILNLMKVYAVNGTFEEGVPGTNVNPNGTVTYHPLGWDVYSNNTDVDQVQMASFDSTGRSYITADNQGGRVGQNEHGHYQDTRILWTQFVDNAPYTEEFILSFDYFYLRGPIDKNITYPIIGNCSITVFADGNPIWNMSLLTLDRRGVWESSGELPITVAGISGAFDFEIGLVIDETLVLDKRWDYDTDGAPDGIGNAAYVTVYLDDVSFVKATPPTPSQVELEFTRGTETVAVTGTSGSGSAVITNQSYWQTNPVSVILSSNTSVSFDYKTRLLSHRFTNSRWETDISHEGVAYTAQFGISPDLALFTYIGFLGDYENPNLRVEYPMDWVNVTVLDPFLSDVTSQCSLGSGFFEVPEHLLDQLGWWKFTLQSPNYAKSISIQKYDEGSGLWDNSTQFRSGNTTRTRVSLGTDVSTPDLSNPVNLTWSLPNASIWSEESLTGGFNGQVNSTSWMLGALNTSAGQWSVSVYWTNGTEVAYGTAIFDMYHTATLTPKHAEIQTESGLVVTNFLYYVDADNGEYLMDDVATIEGNWSSSTLTFNPNLLHNWWETDFDTAAVGSGMHLVVVNASRPYFDNVSSQFTIESTLLTEFTLFVDSGPPIEVGLNEKHIYEFRYELLNGTGIDDAIIDVSFSPTIGLNVSDLISTAPGNYSVEIFSFQSGVYTVAVSANKSYHYVGFDSFMIEVGGFGATLSKENGSADLVSFGDDYRFVVQYANMTGDGLTGATVEIVDMAPSDWIPVGPLVDEGNGYYSILLSPPGTGTFTVIVKANFTNHETQYATFSLTVAAVTIKVVDIQGLSGAEDQLTTITLSVVESNTGQPVTGARVVVQVFVNLEETQSIQLAEVGEGQYSGQFIMPSSDTIAEIKIYASLENYVLDGGYFQTELHPEMSAFALLARTAQQYSPLLVLIGALIVGFIVQKVQSRRSKAEYIEAMVVKRRFDDVRDLLGVIVLHRSSGIPIYSNLLKSGIDDSMLSGFIAAITQFRSEFDVDLKEWQIIPISDIIRTVGTQNLICAFVTLGSPTGTQEERMMQFARAIGFIFDSHFENAPIHVLDDETQDRFETLFNEMLDGALLVKYRTVEAHKLPRNLRLLEKGAAMMDKRDEFELEELARIMTRSGLEEARAYKTIMDGIETGYLEPIDLESYTDQINDSE